MQGTRAATHPHTCHTAHTCNHSLSPEHTGSLYHLLALSHVSVVVGVLVVVVCLWWCVCGPSGCSLGVICDMPMLCLSSVAPRLAPASHSRLVSLQHVTAGWSPCSSATAALLLRLQRLSSYAPPLLQQRLSSYAPPLRPLPTLQHHTAYVCDG